MRNIRLLAGNQSIHCCSLLENVINYQEIHFKGGIGQEILEAFIDSQILQLWQSRQCLVICAKVVKQATPHT
jgi:hypothetical protein